MWRGIGRIAGLSLVVALPGVAVLGGLVAAERLAAGPALLGAAATVVLAAALATAFVISLARLSAAIDDLGSAGGVGGEPRIGPRLALPSVVEPLWPAVLRLRRAWRERAQAAEAGREAAETVIAAIPDPLIMIDAGRRIVGANLASMEFIGTVAEPRDLAAALRNPAVLAAADAVLRGEGARNVEFAVSVPVARLLEARFAQIDAPSAEGAAAILTLHDITALKRAEQSRADFIANAGHELKTPLATLIGFIETLAGPARDDAAARERFLGIMREQAGRMARLVDDLLSLSRIELNEHVAPTARVVLRPVIEHVAAALELHAASRGIRIVLSVPDDLPDVLGDRDELSQVFQNLLDNAIKYARRDTEIAVGAAAVADPLGGDSALRVAVTDRGDGIPGEYLSRLTERFYRVDTARSRELGGTGLGLAIVKHIVSRHRGRLDIVSTPGVGSTFTVWLGIANGPRP